MITNKLSAALDNILKRWVFRPGLRIHGIALDVNFQSKIERIKRPGAPPGFTRSMSGLLLPMRELVSCHNLVHNAGLDDLLDVYLSAGTQDTTWFLGLMAATPTVAAGDTLASHAGWTEFTDYDETNRVAFTAGTPSSQSVDNVGNEAEFTSSSDSNSVGGAFLAGVNTGTTGILYAGAAFGSNKPLDTGETLTTTATFTAASA